MEPLCNEALQIFKASVKAVQPQNLIHNAMRLTPTSCLQIQQMTFPISHNVHVVGFGKAVLGMASAVEHILGDHLVSGIVSVPKGIQEQMATRNITPLKEKSKIKVLEGAANNLPDEESMFAASQISDLVSSLVESDILLVLISGGGSSLLPLPTAPITLSEKLQVIKLLATRGATIQEINIVRKRLSLLKGGGLAKQARPTKVVSLILSDIIGNPLELIASGPTVENLDDPKLPLTILDKYNLKSDIPENVLGVLQTLAKRTISSRDNFSHVTNILLGSNKNAVDAAFEMAEKLGYVTVTLTLELQGVARSIGKLLARLAIALAGRQNKVLKECTTQLGWAPESVDVLLTALSRCHVEDRGLCVLCAGETVVQVTGNGTGGRNQEVALAAATEFHSKCSDFRVALLSAGTDGIDGPTNAAGAMADPSVVNVAEGEGLNAMKFLNNNDSFNFYKLAAGGQWHIITGHTGTNVMDIVVVLIKCEEKKII